MTPAQKARQQRDIRLLGQYEVLKEQHPGSTDTQLILELARRRCQGMASASGIRVALKRARAYVERKEAARAAGGAR